MRKADNLPPYCAVVKKSGSLNFLDPSGPSMACNESALLDRYLKHVEVKGDYRWIGVKNMIITSNRHPKHACNLPYEDIKQTLRRTDYIIEFTSNDMIIRKSPNSVS